MLMDLVRQNRSYRGYDRSRKIREEELVSLVEAARICPSSVNGQPLKYYLACEEPIASRIQPATMWAKGLPELTLPHPGKEPTAFIVRNRCSNYAPCSCRDGSWGLHDRKLQCRTLTRRAEPGRKYKAAACDSARKAG